MENRMYGYIAAVALLVLLTGCTKDYPGAAASGESTITLRLHAPGGGNVGARSIAVEPDAQGENRIDEIDILALTQSGGDWVFDYRAEIVSEVQDGAELVVTAKVLEKTTDQQFVIIVNASAELASAAPVRLENIATIENRLVCGTGGGEWPAENNGGGGFTPFPMYARTGAVTVGVANNSIGNYKLCRMVARIDVTLHNAIDNFELTEACLFNYRTKGYVSYANSGFDGAKATAPAVPASGDHPGNPIMEPTVMYEAVSNAILSSIYTFESPAIVSAEGKTKGTALVVGGKYDGTDEISYYRIDLKTTDDVSTNISSGILRNHSYAVEIQGVSGGGYETPLEAYLGSSRLSARVTPWNQAAQQLVFDDQYRLEVSGDEISFPVEGGTATITASTNYDVTYQGFPVGLQVNESEIVYNPSDDNEWITILNWTNGALAGELTVTAAPSTSEAERSCEIYLKAGNLTKVINVTQVRNSFDGGENHVLYFAGDGTLQVGRWGDEVTAVADLAFFKFGSVVGFTAVDTFGPEDILFDPTGTNYSGTGSTTYDQITGFYSSDDYNAGKRNVSNDAYHSLAYVKLGKGDPCRLAGMRAADIEAMENNNDLTDKEDELTIAGTGGWRLPTAQENAWFVKGPNTVWKTWQPGHSGGYAYTQGSSTDGNSVVNFYETVGSSVANPNLAWLPATQRTSLDKHGKLCLPAAGCRSSLSGTALDSGIKGDYWASDAFSESNGYMLGFDGALLLPVASANSNHSFAVRCVRR